MTIDYQFGDVDAHGALIRARAASLEVERQSSVGDVLAAAGFWGGAGSTAWKEFIAQPGRIWGRDANKPNAPASKRFKRPTAIRQPLIAPASSHWA
jgi:hypothetical protein